MPPFPRLALVVLSLLISTSALADSNGLIGRWSAIESGQGLSIERKNIFFNEHTVCELQTPLRETSSFADELASFESVLDCANIYFMDGEIVRAFEQTITMSAELISKNRLLVTIDDDEGAGSPVLYQRQRQQQAKDLGGKD